MSWLSEVVRSSISSTKHAVAEPLKQDLHFIGDILKGDVHSGWNRFAKERGASLGAAVDDITPGSLKKNQNEHGVPTAGQFTAAKGEDYAHHPGSAVLDAASIYFGFTSDGRALAGSWFGSAKAPADAYDVGAADGGVDVLGNDYGVGQGTYYGDGVQPVSSPSSIGQGTFYGDTAPSPSSPTYLSQQDLDSLTPAHSAPGSPWWKDQLTGVVKQVAPTVVGRLLSKLQDPGLAPNAYAEAPPPVMGEDSRTVGNRRAASAPLDVPWPLIGIAAAVLLLKVL